MSNMFKRVSDARGTTGLLAPQVKKGRASVVSTPL